MLLYIRRRTKLCLDHGRRKVLRSGEGTEGPWNVWRACNEGMGYLPPTESRGRSSAPRLRLGLGQGKPPEAESLLNRGGPKEGQNL